MTYLSIPVVVIISQKTRTMHGALLIQDVSLHLMKHLSDNIEEVNNRKQISMTEK